MQNDYFKIPTDSSLFNIKEIFNAFVDAIGNQGIKNYVSNPNLKFIHDDGSNDIIHGWEKWDDSASTLADLRDADVTTNETHISWGNDVKDYLTQDLSGRFEGTEANEFAFVVQIKNTFPIVLELDGDIGMMIHHEVGNGIGYLPNTFDLDTALIGGFDPLDPETTYPTLFTYPGLVDSTKKALFIPGSGTFKTFSIPLMFTTPDPSLGTLGFKLISTVNSNTLDLDIVVFKNGHINSMRLDPIHHFLEHVQYDVATGLWKLSNDGSSFENLLTEDNHAGVNNHTQIDSHMASSPIHTIPIISESFSSNVFGIDSGLTNNSQAHALSAFPKIVQTVLRCAIIEKGYSVGEEIVIGNNHFDDGSSSFKGVLTTHDASNIYVQTRTPIELPDKSLTVTSAITPANWKIVVRAYT